MVNGEWQAKTVDCSWAVAKNVRYPFQLKVGLGQTIESAAKDWVVRNTVK